MLFRQMKFLTSFSLCYDCNDDILKILTRNCKTTLRYDLGKTHILVYTGGITVLYLCAQLAVLYTYNCFLILIYYRLGQNQFIINKYAVRSLYSLRPIKLAYSITLYTKTSLVTPNSPNHNLLY